MVYFFSVRERSRIRHPGMFVVHVWWDLDSPAVSNQGKIAIILEKNH